jgi:hypothetical protein
LIRREPSEPPQPACGRAGDRDVGSGETHRSTPTQLGDRHARCPIGAPQHEFEVTMALKVSDLAQRDPGIDELSGRGDTVLACEHCVCLRVEMNHIEPP